MSEINILTGSGKESVKVNVDDSFFAINNMGELTLQPSVINKLLPVGSIVETTEDISINGAIYCDGASYLKADYPLLYAVIGDAYGTADALHFNVPDKRGRVGRGVDDGVGRDTDAATRTAQGVGGNVGDNIGSVQADAFQGHHHLGVGGDVGLNFTLGGLASSGIDAIPWGNASIGSDKITHDPIEDGTNGAPRTAAETRTKNIYFKYYIIHD